MDALTFYKLEKGFRYINAFGATVQSAHACRYSACLGELLGLHKALQLA